VKIHKLFAFIKKSNLRLKGANFADNISCLHLLLLFHHILLLESSARKNAQEKSICCRRAAHPSLSGGCCYLFCCLRVPVTYKMWALSTPWKRLRRAYVCVCVCPVYCALARSLKHIKERRKVLYWCKYQFANIVWMCVQYWLVLRAKILYIYTSMHYLQ
jgi:hypothetical protein